MSVTTLTTPAAHAATKSPTMKAVVQDRYGSPDVLEMRDVARPTVGPEQVLVHVTASSVNALDWHIMRGDPIIVRASEGLRRPKEPIRGVDVAGVVEAVGDRVSYLEVGDVVFGTRGGAFAEYVSGRTFVPKPSNLTFEQAAAIPTAGMTALQALRDKGRVEAGQRVLVTGAGGGVGTFAVQIAKAFGAHVTAVTSTDKVDLVRSLGADRVVDRDQQRLTEIPARYDVICDVAGYDPVSRLRGLLAPDGALVVVGAGAGRGLGPVVRLVGTAARSMLGDRRLRPFLSTPTREDLVVLRELAEAGKVTPVIDRTYPLSDVANALRYVEQGQVRGKVVITV